MKSLKEFSENAINERLKNQKDLQLLERVLKSNDVEVKHVPRSGAESVVKIRSKSVDANKVFLMYVRDIDLVDIGSSMNVDF